MNWISKQMKDTRKPPLNSSSSLRGEVYEVFAVCLCDHCSNLQLSLVIWKEKLFLKSKDRIMKAVNELVTKERDGEQISHSELSGVVASFGNPV
jgi:hypothetical protein